MAQDCETKRDSLVATYPHSWWSVGKLSAHAVLSAPIIRYFDIDPALAEFTSGEGYAGAQYAVIGCLDMNSILSTLFQILADAHTQLFQTITPGMTYSETRDASLKLNSVAGEFFNRPLYTIRGSNDAHAIYRSDLWTDMGKLLNAAFLNTSHIQSPVHRSVVFDDQGAVVNILSQSDVLRYVYLNKDSLRTLISQTLRQLNVPTPSVSKLPSTTPALKAFHYMYSIGVSALAVIDEIDGRLVDNLSASDLRGLSSAIFGCLAMPIDEFWRRRFAETQFYQNVASYDANESNTSDGCHYNSSTTR
eukprot:gene24930-30397_t